MQAIKVDSKVFVEKDIIHVAVLKRKIIAPSITQFIKMENWVPLTLNVLLLLGLPAIKLDITQGKAGSHLLYFSANPNVPRHTRFYQILGKPKLNGN